jgi:hypothetical protein
VSWELLSQVLLLMVATAVLVVAIITHCIDKHREDAIKRKEAGL